METYPRRSATPTVTELYAQLAKRKAIWCASLPKEWGRVDADHPDPTELLGDTRSRTAQEVTLKAALLLEWMSEDGPRAQTDLLKSIIDDLRTMVGGPPNPDGDRKPAAHIFAGGLSTPAPQTSAPPTSETAAAKAPISLRPFRVSDSPAKAGRVLALSGGACAFCRQAMTLEKLLVTNRVLPRDGGDHAESNLYALCRSCHKAHISGWTLPATEPKPAYKVQVDRRARPAVVNGALYPSITSAMRATGLNYQQVTRPRVAQRVA